MKIKIGILSLLTSVLSLTATSTFAQTSDQKLGLSIHGGLSDYSGDLSSKFFDTGNPFRAHFGLSGMYYLNSWLDAGISGTYGHFGYTQTVGPTFNVNLFQANAQLRLKLNNGVILKEDSRIRPFILGGIGMANYGAIGSNPAVGGTDLTLTSGAGLTFAMTEQIGLNYTLLYGHTYGDDQDFYEGFSGGFDQFMIHQIGVVFSLGKVVDTDNDGVSDKKDKCPTTPEGVKVDAEGCAIDTDKDGIADHLDKCPEVAGTKALEGCPDSDGDGITDLEDACPQVAGVASAKGCPDADGDGIVDSEDACPNVAGLEKYKGCPDTDGDGVIDSEDNCPKVAGLTSLAGCPDSDGDGVTDSKDKCPTIAGIASNDGCPEVTKETKDVFERALKGIQFESGRDVIKKSSYGILNNVADIMNDNASYKLLIEGHTDSQGDDTKNQTLSEKRAAAVKKYLVDKGISASRLTSKGYGETKPKSTNDTSAGRAINRRVEFTVEF
jgi:outer membrane protein OmpA-like peptidoglycan-associated protein